MNYYLDRANAQFANANVYEEEERKTCMRLYNRLYTYCRDTMSKAHKFGLTLAWMADNDHKLMEGPMFLKYVKLIPYVRDCAELTNPNAERYAVAAFRDYLLNNPGDEVLELHHIKKAIAEEQPYKAPEELQKKIAKIFVNY